MEGTARIDGKYSVGGVLLDRPFKIRRLGHFGYNTYKMDESLHFYKDLLGFRVTDTLDFARVLPDPKTEMAGPSSASPPMSMRSDGREMRSFIAGRSECPPAISFASSRSVRSETACSALSATS